MNQNGKHDQVAIVDCVDKETQPNGKATAFCDPNNPALKPANETDSGKKRSWRRKLIKWSFVTLVIGAGAFGLYLFLKVKRVNVRVDAESRRESVNAKPKTDGGNSENSLTAEAINIARAASGADGGSPNKTNSTASPNSSPSPTPSPGTNGGANLAYTGNYSPVTEQLNNDGANSDGNQQQNGGTQQPAKISDSSVTAPLQNHANVTKSIFVEDLVATPTPAPQSIRPPSAQTRLENKPTVSAAPKIPSAVLPPFGTMLPVRTQGVIFTLRNNSYARLELTRDIAGEGWSLPKGMVLVGRTTGSEYDRAFVNVIGYIDPRENKLVKMSGEVLGSDGAAGIPGKRIGVDRSRLKQTFRKVASTGIQVAGTVGGVLGRGTVILDRSGYQLPYDISGSGRQDQKSAFVKVDAGQPAYVMVADLPKSIQAIDAPGDDELIRAASSLSDREVMELILFGSPDEIRAAMPLMSDEQKRLAAKAIAQENKDK